MEAFIGPDDLAAYLKRTLAIDDALAVIAVNAACGYVRAYMQQHLTAVTDDEIVLSGDDTDRLDLPERPVTKITTVTITTEGEDDLVLAETDYVLLNNALYRKAGWPGPLIGAQPGNVKVKHDHGYTTVPDDIRFVALRSAARCYDVGETSQETIGSYSASYVGEAGTLTHAEKDALDNHIPVRVS